MRVGLLILCCSIILTGCTQRNTNESVLQFVDPMVGTGGHGHTFPGATRPYSMVQLSPDTHLIGWDASSGYHASDSVVYAFSHTHLSGTGIGDLGDVALLPYSSCDSLRPVATFSKTSERATPGYYAVRLDNFGVDVELTSTERVGFHRYKYDNPKERRVMLDLAHILQPNWGHKIVSNTLSVASSTKIEGTLRTQGWAHHHSVSYVIEFSEPAEAIDIAIADSIQKREATYDVESLDKLRVYMKFGESTDPLLVKVAISPVDKRGAEQNMAAELPEWNFDNTVDDSRRIWASALERIQVSSSDTTVLKNFYTALYHTMVAPILWQDTDGRYIGMDKKVRTAKDGHTNYTAFSLWDTFRALHPLTTIINPQLAAQFGQGLVEGYSEGGILPKWPLVSSYTGCMVGYPAVSVLADLVAKDLAPKDLSMWLEASVQSTIYRDDMAAKFAGTRELDLVTRHTALKDNYGFVPADSIRESVSWAVEMAYEDWCVAQIAQRAGDCNVAEKYLKKSTYYQRYIDPQTQMMRPVMGNGKFLEPFNPRYSSHERGDYTEGNAYQWSFFVPHAMDEYMAMTGGKAGLESRLDSLFTTSSQIDGSEASSDITGLIGQYAHGNEPSHHIAYLYKLTDSPHKTQQYLDYIMREFYSPTPDGIIGNEDCGQMSAWYVLSALGFYQVCPGTPVYTLGRPMIDHAVIPVKGGQFEIKVHDNSPSNMYVAKATLNGTELKSPFFNHNDIEKGGVLELFMTDKIM